MREVCFCGWTGMIVEREPTYLGDGDWGLTCPSCGHLDRLEVWPVAVREELVAEAQRRHEQPAAVALLADDERAA